MTPSIFPAISKGRCAPAKATQAASSLHRHQPAGNFPPTRTILTSIPIVAEGEDFLVVSKPPGLLVHPTKPGGPVTLVDLLRALLACELASPGRQVSLVHRLDRETSGLLLAAKTPAAARRFSLDLTSGRIGKLYLALVWGWPEWEARLVDAPLLRQGTVQSSRIWLKQTVHPDGFPARTRLEVVRRFERTGQDRPGRFSLVRAVTETGRLHQIRVHLASTGHPLVGDKIYGPDEGCYLRFIETGWTPDLAGALLLDRHALHAHRLEFDALPGTRHLVEAPLPADMAGFLPEETQQASKLGRPAVTGPVQPLPPPGRRVERGTCP